jgi:hypothetical protein
MIIMLTLPAYCDFNTKHDPEEVIQIICLKPYMSKYGAVFQLNRESRAMARQECKTINNIGASISMHAPADLQAVQLLGWSILKTVFIDVHLRSDLQPVAIMAMIAYAPSMEHLYLTVYTDATSSSLPWLDEDEEEVHDFLKHHGVRFVRVFAKLKSINIDLVCEARITKVVGIVGKFVAEAWMGRTFVEDTVLMALMRRLLRRCRVPITISSAQEQRRFSDDPFC